MLGECHVRNVNHGGMMDNGMMDDGVVHRGVVERGEDEPAFKAFHSQVEADFAARRGSVVSAVDIVARHDPS